MKIIQYYVREVYGNPLEYVKDASDAKILQLLTGHKTIDSRVRELVRDLTGGLVTFQQVFQHK